MREQLKQLEGRRARFRGTFVRYGIKNGWLGRKLPTVLLKDITDREGDVVTDHLWFSLTKSFEALSLQPGELVEFEARACPYWKGYRCWNEDLGLELDYKLAYPTRVRKLTPPKGQRALEEVLQA